jgi:hypothetical protein
MKDKSETARNCAPGMYLTIQPGLLPVLKSWGLIAHDFAPKDIDTVYICIAS